MNSKLFRKFRDGLKRPRFTRLFFANIFFAASIFCALLGLPISATLSLVIALLWGAVGLRTSRDKYYAGKGPVVAEKYTVIEKGESREVDADEFFERTRRW